MTKIKICGITREREIEYLNRLGPDYAGFVFYEKSKRNVSLSRAEKLLKTLSPDIQKVAVTVSPKREEIERIRSLGFDILQVHKTLSAEVLEAAKIPVWYAANIGDDETEEDFFRWRSTLSAALREKITGILCDAPDFGSGKTFDWSKKDPFSKVKQDRTLTKILAGGLDPQNVGDGIRRFHPDAVDVSSGVEGSDGKEEEKISAFIQAVKEADRRLL